MGNILSAIDDDEDKYLALCKKHKKKPRLGMDNPEAGPYGWHAEWLGLKDKGQIKKLKYKKWLKKRKEAYHQRVIADAEEKLARLKERLKDE